MIDILLSTYNGARFVREFVVSLGRQTCRDFRLLVRDDGSADGTAETVRAALAEAGLAAEFAPSSGRHVGVVRSFSELLARSSGRYVMFADQDDVWHPDKVAEMLRLMTTAERLRGDGTPLLLHSDLRVCDADGTLTGDSFIRRSRLSPGGGLVQLMIQNHVTGCASMLNRALRERIRLPLPEEAICHDWYVAMLAAAVGRIVFTERALVDYRTHDDNVFGVPAYDLKNFLSRLSGGRREFRRRLVLTQHQAGAFLRQYGDELDPAAREVVGAWAGIGNRSKLGRIAVCLRYGFRKNTVPRTLGMWWAI